MNVLVKALHEDTQFDLGLELVAGARGLERTITHGRVQKAGLALAGYVECLRPERVQILGRTEVTFLTAQPRVVAEEALERLMHAHPACVVVTSPEIPSTLPSLAEQLGIALFRSKYSTGTLIGRIHDFLDRQLSPEIRVHGVLVDVNGVGVLLAGHSGIGKSECALDLVLRGHRLVADDVVLVHRSRFELIGQGPEVTRHLMEVRGLGIINVKDLFGAAAVRESKRIELFVELSDWEEGVEYERTGIDDLKETILECEVSKVRLPIRPGRNLASIVEVAARNHLLKQQGHHSAREFRDALERRLISNAQSMGEEGE